jgi:hypothetical protein
MTANIIWKVMKARCGTVAAYSAFGASPTPDSPAQVSPPSSGVPGAKAIEYPSAAHSRAMTAREMKLILMVLMTSVSRTSPS